MLPLAETDLGPGSLALFCGAKPTRSADAVWHHPCATRDAPAEENCRRCVRAVNVEHDEVLPLLDATGSDGAHVMTSSCDERDAQQLC